LAEWVEVFVVGPGEQAAGKKRAKKPAKPKAPVGPPGGYQLDRTGGVSPAGRGD
jgi:hypothetical protein